MRRVLLICAVFGAWLSLAHADTATLTALFGTPTPCDGQYHNYPERGYYHVTQKSKLVRGYAASQVNSSGAGDLGWYTFIKLSGQPTTGNTDIIVLEYGYMIAGTAPDRIFTATEGIILEAGSHLELYVQCFGNGTVYPYAWLQLQLMP